MTIDPADGEREVVEKTLSDMVIKTISMPMTLQTVRLRREMIIKSMQRNIHPEIYSNIG